MTTTMTRRRRSSSDGSANLDRFRRYRADRERLQVAKLRGDLLDRKAVAAMVASWVAAFSRGLMAVDSRLSHLMDANEVRTQMREEHRRLLMEFARSGQKLDDA